MCVCVCVCVCVVLCYVVLCCIVVFCCITYAIYIAEGMMHESQMLDPFVDRFDIQWTEYGLLMPHSSIYFQFLVEVLRE